jgi:SPP1 gp7 family putative phage head morphogenesis protein
MNSRRAFTIGMIRTLRRLGPIKRRTRMPRQQHPDLIAGEYYKALLPSIRIARAALNEVKGEILWLLQDERKAQGRQDSPAKERAQQLLDKARRRAEHGLDADNLFYIAHRYGKRTSTFQAEQLDKQVRSQLAVPLSMVESPIVAKLEGFAARNVDLIKTVPDRYFDRIRLDVMAAFEGGTHPSTLADEMEERYGMAENDARRIARDQIGKLNGELNEERQAAMGVTGYTWRTANDDRVRDEHAEREGQHFDWNDAPEDGHPGEAIQCRCYAEPDFEPIMESLDN